MKSTKQIDTKSEELKALIKGLRERLSAIGVTKESLNKEAASLRSLSVRHNDADAANRLDGMRTLVDFTEREENDLRLEIEASEVELADLAAARHVAQKDENFAAFQKEAKFALGEATQLDAALTALHKLTITHRDRLAKMGLFLRESGIDGRTFDGRNLWRKIQSMLHSLSPFEISRQHKEYEQKSYTEILQHLIDVAERTRSGSDKAAVNQ